MKKGFTLLELIMVCVLLTLLIAISQPKLANHYHNMKEKYELDKVLSILNYAKEYSYIKQINIKVSFKEDPYKIIIETTDKEIIKELKTEFSLDFEDDSFSINKGRITNKDFYLLIEGESLSKELKLIDNEIKLIEYL